MEKQKTTESCEFTQQKTVLSPIFTPMQHPASLALVITMARSSRENRIFSLDFIDFFQQRRHQRPSQPATDKLNSAPAARERHHLRFWATGTLTTTPSPTFKNGWTSVPGKSTFNEASA